MPQLDMRASVVAELAKTFWVGRMNVIFDKTEEESSVKYA